MRSSINYKYIAPNTQEFQQLQTFAKSFDHEIQAYPNISVYAHYRDDICFGYSDHVHIPTIYPAFHPSLTRPRDVIQVMNDWRTHTQLSGRVSYIGVPLETDTHRINFPEETMNKLGLVRLKREVYSPY
jgi:hypothetical protein